MDEIERKLDQLAAALMLEETLKNGEEVQVLSAEIYMKGNSLEGGIESNNMILDLLGKDYEDWFDETSQLLYPVVTQQTRKLNKIICDFFGEEPESVDIRPVATSEDLRRERDEQRRNGGASSEQDAGA